MLVFNFFLTKGFTSLVNLISLVNLLDFLDQCNVTNNSCNLVSFLHNSAHYKILEFFTVCYMFWIANYTSRKNIAEHMCYYYNELEWNECNYIVFWILKFPNICIFKFVHLFCGKFKRVYSAWAFFVYLLWVLSSVIQVMAASPCASPYSNISLPVSKSHNFIT